VIIYLDMDGVLVDLTNGWLPYLNEVSGKNIAPEDVDMWGIEKVFDIPFSKARKPLHRPGFWEDLPPYPKAVEFVETLDMMGHMVYIATTPFPSEVCAWGKKQWCENHLPFLAPNRLILIHDKFRLHGDMLVDDKPENLVPFRGTRVLFNQPWNKTLTTGLLEQWFIRVSTYSDILAMLGQEY
jgi:5'(3')-deoxyribonucleotidase